MLWYAFCVVKLMYQSVYIEKSIIGILFRGILEAGGEIEHIAGASLII